MKAIRERIYEWMASRFGWGYVFRANFYLGPEWLDKPRYLCRAELMRQAEAVINQHLNEGAERIELVGNKIGVVTEQGTGRRVVGMSADFEMWPRSLGWHKP